MGKYKVFNGTNWVDICDCQVNIRNANDTWQLLNPNNCVTKYWTGTEWCPIVCTCICETNYILDPVTNECVKQTTLPATASGGQFYPIIIGNKVTSYSGKGGALYPNITNMALPIQGVQVAGGTYTLYQSPYPGPILTRTLSVVGNQIFNSDSTTTKGRLNISTIWGDRYGEKVWFTVRFCVTISTTKTYIFAIASDNQAKVNITSSTFRGGVTSLNIVNIWAGYTPGSTNEFVDGPFTYWHMLPIDLPAGDHVFELSGYNVQAQAAFGSEIYDISVTALEALMASTTATPADLEPYILFTTKDLVQTPPLLLPGPGQTGITYTCPDGYTFTDCNGAPQCVSPPDIYPCGDTPPLPPCECVAGEVAIGSQTWKCSNLNVSTYRNGDPIPEVTDPVAWDALTTGAWCHYNNDPANEAIYGKLYNWFAVNDSRGLAPVGYHVPTLVEFQTLRDNLGGAAIAGEKMKEVGTTHWSDPNIATNESCFTALPGGFKTDDGTFYGINTFGHFWSNTPNSGSIAPTAYGVSLVHDSGTFTAGSTAFSTRGYSVRLIKD